MNELYVAEINVRLVSGADFYVLLMGTLFLKTREC